jgi:AraC-like DNA-binding protein
MSKRDKNSVATNYSISSHFVQTFSAVAVKRNKLDYNELLKNSGINGAILSNPKLRVTPHQLSRLLQEIWRVADDEFMCMGSEPSRHGIFALMAKQAVHCKSLRSVYNHISQFYNLVTTAFRLELSATLETATFSLTLSDRSKDPNHTFREFLLLLWHRFPSWLIGQRIPLKEVHMDFPKPAHYAEYRLIYPCDVKFDQEKCRIIFDARYLTTPVVQTTSSLTDHLQRAPLDWFKRQAYFDTYTRKAIDYLEGANEIGSTNIEKLADELHLTSRTLRRKLIKEDTSFQKLKDDIRRDKAIHLLNQPAVPISQIARELGFSEPSAFTRAFKQWTGISPRTYRKS